MSEQSNDITIINPSGREVVVPNELAQDLLLQDGFKLKTADAPKGAEAKKVEAAPEAPADAPKEASTPRSRASK